MENWFLAEEKRPRCLGATDWVCEPAENYHDTEVELCDNLTACFSSHFSFSDSEVLVKAFGQRPENIILLVHEVFEALISEFFRGVKYEYQVPCTDCLRMVSHLVFRVFLLH